MIFWRVKLDRKGEKGEKNSKGKNKDKVLYSRGGKGYIFPVRYLGGGKKNIIFGKGKGGEYYLRKKLELFGTLDDFISL